MKHHTAVTHGPAVGVGSKIHGGQRHRDRNIALRPSLPVIIGVDDVPSLPDSHYAITRKHSVIKQVCGSQVGLPSRSFDDIRKRKRWREPNHGKPEAGCPRVLHVNLLAIQIAYYVV